MRDAEPTEPVGDVRRLRQAARLGAAEHRRKEARARRHARSRRAAPLVRTFVPVLVAAGGLGVAVLLGIRWAEATAPPPPRGVSAPPVAASRAQAALTTVPVPAKARAQVLLRRASPAAADWAGVLRALDGRRSKAFAAAEPAGLAGVYAPGSPPLRQDTAKLAQLRAAGLRARGLRLAVESVSVRDTAPGRVVLSVVDRMPPYEVIDETGRVVRHVPGRGHRQWEVTLVPVAGYASADRSPAATHDPAGGWLIADIVPDLGRR